MKIQKCVLIDLDLKSRVNGRTGLGFSPPCQSMPCYYCIVILETIIFTTLAVPAFVFLTIITVSGGGGSEPPKICVFAKSACNGMSM